MCEIGTSTKKLRVMVQVILSRRVSVDCPVAQSEVERCRVTYLCRKWRDVYFEHGEENISRKFKSDNVKSSQISLRDRLHDLR